MIFPAWSKIDPEFNVPEEQKGWCWWCFWLTMLAFTPAIVKGIIIITSAMESMQ